MAPRRARMHLIRPDQRSAPPVNIDFEWSGVVEVVDDLEFERGFTVTGDPVMLIVPAGGGGVSGLRTEVEVGVQMVRTFAADNYPAQLSRLVGYAAERTGAVVTYDGRPLDQALVESVPTKDLPAVADSLFTALEKLVEARVVHRAVTPGRVLWNGTSVQLVGFRNAVVTPPAVRRGDGLAHPPWSSPEQLSGIGHVGHEDDLYGALALLWWLYTREQPGPAGTMGSRVELQSDDLVRRLAGVFAERAQDRPSLAELRRRWRPAPVIAPRTPALEDADRQARSAFRDLRRRQHADRNVALATAPMFREGAFVGRPAPVPRRIAGVAVLLLLAVLAIIALNQVG